MIKATGKKKNNINENRNGELRLLGLPVSFSLVLYVDLRSGLHLPLRFRSLRVPLFPVINRELCQTHLDQEKTKAYFFVCYIINYLGSLRLREIAQITCT